MSPNNMVSIVDKGNMSQSCDIKPLSTKNRLILGVNNLRLVTYEVAVKCSLICVEVRIVY